MMDRRHHHKSDLGSGATKLGLNLKERKRGSGERPWLRFWIVTPSNWRGTWGSGHSPLVGIILSKSSINENRCLFHADIEVHTSKEDMIKSYCRFTNIATHKVGKNLQEQRKEESSYGNYTSEPLGKGTSLGNNEKMSPLPQIFLVNNMSHN